MKIHNTNQIAKLQSYQQNLTKMSGREKSLFQQKSDDVKISTEAKRILSQKTEGQTLDAIKINRIKEQIENGTYRPNSDRIAEKLLALWKKF